jgi:hypothetical protein
MTAMKIISYIVCGFGLLGGLAMLTNSDVVGGIMAILVYGFFLAMTINIKI